MVDDEDDIGEVHMIDYYSRSWFPLRTILSVLSPHDASDPKTRWHREGHLEGVLADDHCCQNNKLTHEEQVEAIQTQFPFLKEVKVDEIIFLDNDGEIQWDNAKLKELEKSNVASLQQEVMSVIGWNVHKERARIIDSGGTVPHLEPFLG